MKVGLLGYLASGKSTLFRAAAGAGAKGEMMAIKVPDERFDAIVKQVNPKKATPATLIFHDDLGDIQGEGSKKFSQKLIDQARKMDLLVHVVRAFESEAFPYHDTVDPIRDQKAIEEELVLIDLQIIENRLERLKKMTQVKSPGTPEYAEKMLFERLVEPLSEGVPLKNVDLNENDLAALKNYQFLSLKPLIVAFNVDEDQAAEPSEKLKKHIESMKSSAKSAFTLCASIEEEIAQLDSNDQLEFLSSLGIKNPASHKVIQVIYETLGLITFFTAGEGETRAWPLKAGSTALKAADTIHSDIAKGFIRAEVVHYQDYLASGTLDKAYSEGKMKLEGREYIIEDGDLIHIRNKS